MPSSTNSTIRRETLTQKIKRVTAESVSISEYDVAWPLMFNEERNHLYECLPDGLIIKIEHFGSTSIPGMPAKPIIDMIIEISDEDKGKAIIPETLEPKGYDCFWRPLGSTDKPPYFTWCIKRNKKGLRTHHLHFVRPGFKDAELRFRDVLCKNPQIARAYSELKKSLSQEFTTDRVAYTQAKGQFIREVLMLQT